MVLSRIGPENQRHADYQHGGTQQRHAEFVESVNREVFHQVHLTEQVNTKFIATTVPFSLQPLAQ